MSKPEERESRKGFIVGGMIDGPAKPVARR
jgi:hypothetical protein